MNAFQWISLGILSVLLIGEFRQLWGVRSLWHQSTLRALIWCAAAGAIVSPMSLQHVAEVLGIQRAADLVSYIFILTFLVTSFYFYSHTVRLQRRIDELVRHVALENPQRGQIGMRDEG